LIGRFLVYVALLGLLLRVLDGSATVPSIVTRGRLLLRRAFFAAAGGRNRWRSIAHESLSSLAKQQLVAEPVPPDKEPLGVAAA